jgi:hypothetical protein
MNNQKNNISRLMNINLAKLEGFSIPLENYDGNNSKTTIFKL